MKVFAHVAIHAKACADAGRINMVFPSDPDSFEFWAERWDSPSAADGKFQAFVMRTSARFS